MFSAAQVRSMWDRLHEVAGTLGLTFTPQAHAPNTKPALAIVELARRQGRLDAWREAGMNAYWRDGRNIEDPAVLRELAADAGLDPSEALAFLDTAEVPGLLAQQRQAAMRWGVTGIPTWFLLPAGWSMGDDRPPEGEPQPVRVVGCQPMDVVLRAAELAGATPASPPDAT